MRSGSLHGTQRYERLTRSSSSPFSTCIVCRSTVHTVQYGFNAYPRPLIGVLSDTVACLFIVFASAAPAASVILSSNFLMQRSGLLFLLLLSFAHIPRSPTTRLSSVFSSCIL